MAEEVTPPAGYPREIQLNFKAKLDIRDPKLYELAIIKTESRQWCVLLCVSCHKKVEEVTQAVYQKDYSRGDIPRLPMGQKLHRLTKS